MDDFENPNILVVFPVFDFIVKIVISFFDKKKIKRTVSVYKAIRHGLFDVLFFSCSRNVHDSILLI